MCNCSGPCTTMHCEEMYDRIFYGDEPEENEGGIGPSIKRTPLVVKKLVLTKTIWVTKEGERIHVREMGDQHLVNTIRYLRRVGSQAKMALEIESPNLNGEMAQFFAERAHDKLLDMSLDEFLESEVETWPALLAEAERRKLNV